MRFEDKPNKPDNFLLDEISKPRNQWSNAFKNLVAKQKAVAIEESLRRSRIKQGLETDKEESSEVELEHVFQRYIKELGLSKKDLKNKRVMDLGFGEGYFVKYLISEGITNEAYGIDSHPGGSGIEEQFKDHLFKKSSEEEFPVRDLDYVVAVRSVWPNWEWKDSEPMNVNNILENSLSALKDGGELRIYPVEKSAEGDEHENFTKEQEHLWNEAFSKLLMKYNFVYRFEPINIFVNEYNDSVTLQSVLIIKKGHKN